MLDRENLDAVLLNAQHNFAWLIGGGSNGVDLSRENGVASLLITRGGDRYLFASMIEIDRMLDEELSEEDFAPIDYSWEGEKADPGLVIEKARSLLETGAALATDIPLDSSAPAVEGIIAACRHELTGFEVERYRELGRDAGEAAQRVIDRAMPGQTELEVAADFRNELARYNINSVVTLAAGDERIAKYRHPVPTINRWRDSLLIVTCAKRGGLIASLSRIICAGEIPDELRSTTEAAASVNARLMSATLPGTTGAELYETAAKAYADQGFATQIHLHHQGGATGYKTRDWVAHPQSKEIVKMNQAFAWNPSITGTKVEETGIVTRDGFEVITATADFPQVTVSIDGTDFHSPGILSLAKGAAA